MSGIAGEEQPAELHRFDDKATERRNALLNNRAIANNEARFGGTPRIQLLPDSGIRPLVEVFIGSALQVEPAEDQRAHGEKSEASLVIRVDQLFGGGSNLGENSQPTKGIDPLVRCKHTRGDG